MMPHVTPCHMPIPWVVTPLKSSPTYGLVKYQLYKWWERQTENIQNTIGRLFLIEGGVIPVSIAWYSSRRRSSHRRRPWGYHRWYQRHRFWECVWSSPIRWLHQSMDKSRQWHNPRIAGRSCRVGWIIYAFAWSPWSPRNNLWQHKSVMHPSYWSSYRG
jgi:hypothetical protein